MLFVKSHLLEDELSTPSNEKSEIFPYLKMMLPSKFGDDWAFVRKKRKNDQKMIKMAENSIW